MTLNTTVYKKFRDAFEQKCFQLIIDAYRISISEKNIQLDWDENDISAELQRHLKENQLRIKWRVSTNVESHIPKDVHKVKGFSSKFPRIDFRLTSFISTHEYEYFFEAKNLRQNDSALKRRYIDTGINNFVSKKYENGSLIGYLLEGNTNEIIENINHLLEKDKRNTETLKLKSNMLLDSYYESSHSGIGILKHLIFDFTIVSN
jgi:hypothetical protein